MTRDFTEWGKGIYNRLPSAVRNSLRSSGICHFLVVIRDPDTKTITSFDFGPIGGDVAGLPGLRSRPAEGLRGRFWPPRMGSVGGPTGELLLQSQLWQAARDADLGAWHREVLECLRACAGVGE